MRTLKIFRNCLFTAVSVACMPIAIEAKMFSLWPSNETELRVLPDSRMSLLPDGSMSVTTGVKHPWPGVRMDFHAGEWDLSAYGMMTISVSNTMDFAQTVHVSVKGRTLQGQTPGGSVAMAPHATAELTIGLCNMPWALDAPLELNGMRGYPGVAGSGTTFDLKRTTSIHVFFMQKGTPGGFSIRSISVSDLGIRQKVLPADTFLPFVDRYGQFRHDTWPGKIFDDTDLAAARDREDAWLAKNGESPIPEANRYGGWAGGPQLKATGYFRTEKVKGKWWLVDPEGRLFFSHGVNCVQVEAETGIGLRENYFAWLPPKDDPVFGAFRRKITWPAAHGFYRDAAHIPYETYDFARANAVRKYGSGWKKTYAARAHARLRAWGLNTIANWSDPAIYGLRKTPYTIRLDTRGTPRLKNSAGWWGALPDPFDPAFELTLRSRAQYAAKKMGTDPWCVGVFVDNELSWNEEPRMAEVAEGYFSTVRRVLKKELPNHLYLGCRIAWGKDVIYRAAARHCDVVSVNIYSRYPQCDLPPGADDKPMINGEFHFGALDRGMFHTGLVPVRDQNERADCYRSYVNTFLDHPRFVGTHWFQWYDQALTGRFDGENYQIGFVSIADSPYMELVTASRDIAATMYRRRFYGASSDQ